MVRCGTCGPAVFVGPWVVLHSYREGGAVLTDAL